jgi:predicted secreted protein
MLEVSFESLGVQKYVRVVCGRNKSELWLSRLQVTADEAVHDLQAHDLRTAVDVTTLVHSRDVTLKMLVRETYGGRT